MTCIPGHYIDTREVHFKDGSTPVSMKASIRVGPQGSSIEELNDAIYLLTYATKNDAERIERVENILESAVVPQLQALEISAALLEKDSVADSVNKNTEAIEALVAIGIELNPQKGLIISDIALTPEIIAQRQKKLEGTSEAEKQKALGLGYARSITAIIEELKCSRGEALSIYNTQRGLETLEKLKSNVSLVASDIKGVLKTMNVGDANPRNHQTEGGGA